MQITLDSESQRLLEVNREFVNAGEDQLAGMVHDAWLTGLLSRGTEGGVIIETSAEVVLDGIAVELATEDRQINDPRGAAVKQAQRLADVMGLPPERMPALYLAAIRVGFRRLITPDMVEWVERLRAQAAQKAGAK